MRSGKLRLATIDRAKELLETGHPDRALRILAGGVHGTGFNVDFYELFGRVLLANDQILNAGRFLFLSGSRNPEYVDAIEAYLKRNHDPGNFRQLHSSFPETAKTIWKLNSFPEAVRHRLKKLGFPDDIQEYFLSNKCNASLK